MGKAENSIEFACKELATCLGWVVYKGAGVVGAPDGIFLKGGRGFTVEFKTESGKHRQSQICHGNRLTSLGVPYYLCNDIEVFKSILIGEEGKFNE